jgi:hypothetical protein
MSQKTNFHDLLGRTFGIANIDVLGTLVVAYAVSKKYDLPLAQTIGGFLIAGEVVHLIIGVQTPITQITQSSPSSN